MSVSCGVEASLVELSSFPIVVEVAEPFVHLEVVQSHIGDHLFLDGFAVSCWCNAVFQSQGGELGVSVQAVFD